MKVLIVNGFSSTAIGQKSFQLFVSSIREAFSLQHFYSVTNIEFETVDVYSVDQYLSELNTGFLSRDSEKVSARQLFDHLDFVFIDGDANILPWYERARKFLILIRMCKKTRKLLFACSFAMQIFVYLCATNLYISRVVNGNGKGTPKAEFAAVDKKKLNELVFGDVFIDSTTGDVYGFDSQKGEFYPIANAGIHNHKSAQEYGTL
jgi:hypothetical protein